MSRSPRSRLSWVVASSCAAILTACPTAAPIEEATPPVPRIVDFSAAPKRVKAGEKATLSWETRDATRISIVDGSRGTVSGVEDSKTSGNVEVTVSETTLFVLEAEGGRGVRTSAAVSVTVEEAPEEVLFVATPAETLAGEPVTLAWHAPGADAVGITASPGGVVELGGQLDLGSVQVRPVADTTWTLQVGAHAFTAQARVRPVISKLTTTPESAIPGEPLTLHWQAAGAARVEVTLAGTGVIHTTSNAAQVADGSFTLAVPLVVDPAAAFTFIVRAEHSDPTRATLAEHTTWVAGQPRITAFNVPTYAPLGETLSVSWTTRNADEVELLQDGVVVYRSPYRETAEAGSAILPTPSQPGALVLRARNLRGGLDTSESKTVDPVGKPTVTEFSATPDSLAAGGAPVTLTWNVPHARNLTITAKNQFVVWTGKGPTSQAGTLTLFPNANTEYVLTADNGLGDAIPATSVNVAVLSPSKLVFSPAAVPAGGTVTITNTTGMSVTEVQGLPNVVVNPPNEGFIDIRTTGTNIGYTGTDTAAQLVTLPQAFSTAVFGQPLTAEKLSVSINGWFFLSTSTLSGPDGPVTRQLHTELPAFAIAPYFADLIKGSGAIYYRLDTLNGEQRLIVQWNNVGRDTMTGSALTFQAQVHASGKVVFAYSQLQGVAADNPLVGVVSAGKLASLATAAAPVEGDAIALFDWATLPLDAVATGGPLRVRVRVGNTFMVVDDLIPVMPAGKFVINELNPFPAANRFEWFELENRSADAMDLSGWTIDFGGSTHVITGTVVLPPNGRLLFGQDPDAGEQSAGGSAVDYVYGAANELGDASGKLALSLRGGVYTSTTWATAPVQGESLMMEGPRSDLKYASGVTELRCAGTASYGSAGQKGTPGGPNTRCFSYVMQPAAPNGFTPLMGTTGAAVVGSLSGGTGTDSAYPTLNLVRPVKVFGQSYSTLYVSSDGFISLLPLTSSYLSNATTPSSSAPNGVLAPYWDDLVGNTSNSQVLWKQFDPDAVPATGDEYTLVSFENWKRYGYASSLNFQVKFFEASGDFEFHFGTMTADTPAYAQGGYATTWVENVAGTAAILINADSTTPGIQPNTGFRFIAQ